MQRADDMFFLNQSDFSFEAKKYFSDRNCIFTASELGSTQEIRGREGKNPNFPRTSLTSWDDFLGVYDLTESKAQESTWILGIIRASP